MIRIIKQYRDAIMPSLLFICNVSIQCINLQTKLFQDTDEGVYLYAARLIFHGYIPYKDFFLAHPVTIFYVLSPLLFVSQFHIILFHFLLVLWVLSIIFPLYFIIKWLTKSTWATTLSIILLISYSEFQITDVISFSLRQASLPFFVWALFFLIVYKKKILSGLLFGVFSLCIITNFALTALFIFLFILEQPRPNWNKNVPLLISFLITALLGYILLFSIPHSFQNIISFQFSRQSEPFFVRLFILLFALIADAPIFLFGILGAFTYNRNVKLYGIYNLLAIFALAFFTNSFINSYLVILAGTLCISAGIFFSSIEKRIGEKPHYKIVFVAGILTFILFTSFPRIMQFATETNTQAFAISSILKTAPGPTLTFQPMYAVVAQRDIVFQYHVADERYFTILGVKHNLEPRYSIDLVRKSKTVVTDEYLRYTFSKQDLAYIHSHFRCIYHSSQGDVYEREKITGN